MARKVRRNIGLARKYCLVGLVVVFSVRHGCLFIVFKNFVSSVFFFFSLSFVFVNTCTEIRKSSKIKFLICLIY